MSGGRDALYTFEEFHQTLNKGEPVNPHMAFSVYFRVMEALPDAADQKKLAIAVNNIFMTGKADVTEIGSKLPFEERYTLCQFAGVLTNAVQDKERLGNFRDAISDLNKRRKLPTHDPEFRLTI